MDKGQQELKKFLEEQLQWSKEQDRILEKIESKLHEMKRIAEYALVNELNPEEVKKLNVKLNELKNEVHSFERQLPSVHESYSYFITI